MPTLAYLLISMTICSWSVCLIILTATTTKDIEIELWYRFVLFSLALFHIYYCYWRQKPLRDLEILLPNSVIMSLLGKILSPWLLAFRFRAVSCLWRCLQTVSVFHVVIILTPSYSDQPDLNWAYKIFKQSQ